MTGEAKGPVEGRVEAAWEILLTWGSVRAPGHEVQAKMDSIPLYLINVP